MDKRVSRGSTRALRMGVSLVAGLALVGCDSNQAPGTPAVSIGPVDPDTRDDLVLQIDGSPADEDGDATSLTVTWRLDGEIRADLADALRVPAAVTAKGQTWSVEVRAFDGVALGEAQTAELTIGNAPPEAVFLRVPVAPAVDEDLVVAAEGRDPDADPVSLTWSWTVDGVDAGITEPVVPAARTRRGEVWVATATPEDGEDTGEAVTATIDVANRRPTVQAVAVAPGRATETTTLRASGVVFDEDGDPVTLTWAWYVDGVEVARGPAATLTPDNFGRGQVVVASAIPNDGFVDGLPVASAPVEIGNTAPVAAGATLSTLTPREADTLTCTAEGLSDLDGDDVTATFAWEVNGRPAAAGATLDGAYFNRGDQVVCVVTPTDGVDDGAAVRSRPATVANTAPVLADATLDLTEPRRGDTVGVTLGDRTDDDGDVVELVYAWYADDVRVGSGPTLDLAAFPKGTRIRVEVTPRDGLTSGETVSSAEVAIQNSAPVVSAASLTPSAPKTNDTLTASWTAADVDADPLTATYTWRVDGVVVEGQTGRTLAGSFFQKGQEVEVEVVVNDGTADSAALRSAAIAVLNTAPTFTSVAVSPLEAFEDDTLTCAAAGWTDVDGDTEDYQITWFVNGAPVSTADSLSGSAFDRDDSVWCTATPFDGAETGAPRTAAAIVIQNTAPTLAGVTLSSVAPKTGDLLSAVPGSSGDRDGDTVTLRYTWTIDGVPAGTGTSLDLDGVSAGARIELTVTPFDGTTEGEPVIVTAEVQNTDPVVTEVTLSPSVVRTEDTLTARVVATDADGDIPALEYTWYVDGAPVSEDGPTLSGAFFDRDQEVYVEVVADDGTGRSTAVASAVVVVANTAPTLASATLDKTELREADTLTCAPGGFLDADDDPALYTYLWSNGATTPTIDGSTFRKGDVLSCTITPGDGTDTGPAVVSASATVLNSAPTLASVALPGRIVVGDAVSPILGSVSDVDGDTVTLRYDWRIDGVTVSDAPSLPADLVVRGDVLTLTVTPEDGEVAGSPVASAAVTVANSAPVASVTLSPGAVLTDGALTATPVSSDADADPLTISYTWLVDGVPVSGETTASLSGDFFDKGEVVEVEIAVDDGVDTTIARSAGVTVGNTAPAAPTVSFADLEPADDADLVCVLTAPATDLDGDPLTYTIAWTVDDVAWTGAVGTTDAPGDTISAADTDVGQRWRCSWTPDDGDDTGPAGSALVEVGECAVELVGAAHVSLDYLAATTDDGAELYVGFEDTVTDSVGWVAFDLSGLAPGAEVLTATLSLYESGGGALGEPSLDLVYSDDDGWIASTVTTTDLLEDDVVSLAPRTTVVAGAYNTWTVDLDAWPSSADLADGEVSFGVATATEGGLVTFYGTGEPGKEPRLALTLSACD